MPIPHLPGILAAVRVTPPESVGRRRLSEENGKMVQRRHPGTIWRIGPQSLLGVYKSMWYCTILHAHRELAAERITLRQSLFFTFVGAFRKGGQALGEQIYLYGHS